MTAEAAPVSMTSPATARRGLSAAIAGGVVESFDWACYGVLAPSFASDVFPGGDHGAKVIGAYATFAVGFLFRPLGGMILGRMSDVRGRRFTFSLSVTVIALASLVMAVTPGHRVLGAGSAVIFILARIVQGLSAGGEAPTVAAYVAETAPGSRRYLYSALSYGGLIFGSILAFAVLAVLTAAVGKSGVENGGWRIGFAVSACCGLVALWIRRRAPESPEYRRQAAASRSGAAGADGRVPLLPALLAHRRQSLAIFLITVGGTVGFYFGTLYLPTYAHEVGAVGSVTSAAVQIDLAMVGLIAVMAGFGNLADRIDGLRVMRVTAVVECVVTPPLMIALNSGTLPFLVVAACYLVAFAPGLAIGYVLGARLFPVSIRSVGFGIPGAVAGAVFGGTFLLVAHALSNAGHITLVPWYATACAALGVVGVFLIRPTDFYTAEFTDPAATVPQGRRVDGVVSER
ncbi:MFS transporter [Streptomyces sp. NPDC048441]|uniref:MFS transporter n=1 Tax=Streptomyces sp. NPDC048441 TaxID=3365552 RepID=UPI003713E6A0